MAGVDASPSLARLSYCMLLWAPGHTMQTVDFSRSFLTFRIDTQVRAPVTVTHPPCFTLNEARAQIECCCRVTDRRANRTERFLLGASCKTERVGVARGIWTTPNADFAPVVSDDWFISVKTYAHAGTELSLHPPSLGPQSSWHRVPVAEALAVLKVDIRYVPGEAMETPDAIVAAVLANDPLVGRTRYLTGPYAVELDYPVKLINASERENAFQVDTGPVLWLEAAGERCEVADGLSLAFVAFNAFDWVEVLVRDLTHVAQDVDVYHYARPGGTEAQNQVFRLRSA